MDLDNRTLSVYISPVFVGRTELIYQYAGNLTKIAGVRILRTHKDQMLGDIFTGVLTLLVIVNTFMMGTQLNLKIIRDNIKKPLGICIGFCCQYLIMPGLAFGFGRFLLAPMGSNGLSLWFGYFAIGCSPGGGPSNFWTILLEGNIDLSVVMTAASNLFALGMMPLWLYTLGRSIFANEVAIPFINIVIALSLLVVPTSLGCAFAHWKPVWVKRFQLALKILSVFILVMIAVIFAVSPSSYFYGLINWRTVICGCMLPYCGFGMAYTFARLPPLSRNHRDALTIAIETGIQNAGIAIILCTYSLEQPESDYAIVMPVIVLALTGIPLWITLIVNLIRKKNRGEAQIDFEMKMTRNRRIIRRENTGSLMLEPLKMEEKWKRSTL